MFNLKKNTEKLKELFSASTGKGMESKIIIPKLKELEENIENYEINTGIDEENGVYYGVNLNTNKKIYYNKNNLHTGHEFILGVHGSGKSNLVKSEVKEIYKNTSDVIVVIQDETEMVSNLLPKNDKNCSYSSLAELYNEKHVRVPNYLINPFQLYESYDGTINKDELLKKAEFIMSFMSAVIEYELTAIQKSLIARAIDEMYTKFSDSAIPKMIDFIKLLKSYDFKELELIIIMLEQKYKKGLSNFDYNNEIDSDLNDRFIVYSMYGVNYDIYNETILILLENIRGIVVKNSKKQVRTHIIVDSIDGIVNDIVGQYLKVFLKRLRINYGMVTLVGSDTDSIINNQYYNAIIYNLCDMGTIRLLNQNIKSIEELSEILKISKSGKWYINNSERGTGLLISDNFEIPFKFEKK